MKNNIVHLKFMPKNAATFKEIVCTSNTKFIAVFSALKDSAKKRALHSRANGIATKDLTSVLTFNLIENKYNTIDLSRWEVVAFLTITEDNIEILDKVTNELLKKEVIHDLK